MHSEFHTLKNERKKKTWNPFLRNLLIAIFLFAVSIALLSVWFLVRPDNETEDYDLFNIEMISELTTLECRYHNVSVYDNEGGLLGAKKQYVWFEYDVIVDVGIDINEVRIENPNDNGIVKIYLPPAKIFGTKVDRTSIHKPVCELGLFAKLTASKERQIIDEGVEKLKNDTKTQEVIAQAYNSARNVLEQYVINVGKMLGEEYKVEWLQDSDETNIESEKMTDTPTEEILPEGEKE